MKEVTIYTDGACSGNPGPGGWAAILLYKGHQKEMSGSAEHATNQRMELTAAIEALRVLKEPCKVTLYSDSAYLVNCFQQRWFERWEKNGWRNSKGDPVENRDLWEALLALTRKHDVTFVKVKGHSDDPLNNRCDALAVAVIPKGT